MYDDCQMEKPAKWFDLRFISDGEMETTAGEKGEGTSTWETVGAGKAEHHFEFKRKLRHTCVYQDSF